MNTLACVLKNEEGQDLVEYTLLISFVVATTAALAIGYRDNIAGIVGITNSNLQAANSVAQ
jgi:hypothetical protein